MVIKVGERMFISSCQPAHRQHRVSPHYYNNSEDEIDLFLDALPQQTEKR